jgi:hypothetical protein
MTQFALENTSVIINGHTVTGWSEATDALSLPEVDLAAVKRGADGKMVSASTGNKGGAVVIKLLPNSPSTKFFMNAVTAQLNGVAITWYGLIRDSRNGITLLMTGGTLTKAPLGASIGKGEVKNCELTFEFESIIPDYSVAKF